MTKAHALIIDDDAQNLEVLKWLLASHGVTNTAVQDTNQLENVLATVGQVDMVFLDLEMPGRDGYQLFDVLKNRLAEDIPIVACTVHSNEIARTREMGFNGFIGKPLSPQLFATQLARLIEGRAVWDAT
jgi:CheY-like chemotaxis protein